MVLHLKGRQASMEMEIQNRCIDNVITLLLNISTQSVIMLSLASVQTKNDCNSCISFITKIELDEPDELAIQTKVSREKWLQARRYRITGSRIYEIYTYKGKSWDVKSQKYFNPKGFVNKFTQHGIAQEANARKVFSKYMKMDIYETGLIISNSNRWIGFSPDGIVLNEGNPVALLEIKCPYAGRTPINQLESISQTDLECTWATEKQNTKETYKPIPISEMPCFKERKDDTIIKLEMEGISIFNEIIFKELSYIKLKLVKLEELIRNNNHAAPHMHSPINRNDILENFPLKNVNEMMELDKKISENETFKADLPNMDNVSPPPLFPINFEIFPGPSENSNWQIFQQNEDKSADWDEFLSVISSSQPTVRETTTGKGLGKGIKILMGKELPRKRIAEEESYSETTTIENSDDDDDDFKDVVKGHEQVFVNNIKKCQKKVKEELTIVQKDYSAVQSKLKKVRETLELEQRKEKILKLKRNKLI
ncbi:hypothetical protein FQR65_LT15279 [Abscondita terminalis]|nr:hypothetical protein FQR65_LT15279 [Abscondita terminalis]